MAEPSEFDRFVANYEAFMSTPLPRPSESDRLREIVEECAIMVPWLMGFAEAYFRDWGCEHPGDYGTMQATGRNPETVHKGVDPMNRRCKVLCVSDDFLMHAILGWGTELIPRYRVVGLPEGWDILRVGHNFTTCCIEALICHPSFDEVKDGEQFPVLTNVVVEQVDDGSTVHPTKVEFRRFL